MPIPRILTRLTLACAAILLALPAFAAPPAPAPASTIDTTPPVLIVDMKRILDESKAAINAQKKIEVQRRAFQDEIAARENDIRNAEQELQQSRGKVDAAQFSVIEDKLRARFRDVEKYVQDRRQALENATTASMGKVRGVLLSIVADIARKRGSHVVLVKQQVIWSDNSLDITDETLARLNGELPDVPVSIPAAPAAPLPAPGEATPAEPAKPASTPPASH